VTSHPNSVISTTTRWPRWRWHWAPSGYPDPPPRLRPELCAGAQARQARDWLRRGVTRRPEQRAVYLALFSAAVSVLPPWARDELDLSAPGPLDLLVDTVAVIPVARAVSAGMRWLAAPEGTRESDGGRLAGGTAGGTAGHTSARAS
jgi:hypothetical protein